jgi:hypothetical protein
MNNISKRHSESRLSSGPKIQTEAFYLRQTVESEAADRVIFFGEAHLRYVADEYSVHCHRGRNHQGLEGKIIDPAEEVGPTAGTICRRERLGGMLNYYFREAA